MAKEMLSSKEQMVIKWNIIIPQSDVIIQDMATVKKVLTITL